MTASRLAVALLLAAVGGCDAGSPAASTCSAEDGFENCTADEISEVAADLDGKHDTWFTYDSAYANVVLVGATQDGEDVVAIIGRHSPDYPYFGSDPWDNVLLMVGSRQLTRTDDRMDGLTMSGFGDGDDGGRVALDTDLFDADGNPTRVRLDWDLAGNDGGSRFLGLWPLGLQWSPTSLEPTRPLPTLTIDGTTAVLSDLRGLSESGELNNMKDENFAVMYDALFVLPRSGQTPSFAYADIATTMLPGSSKAAVLDPVLEKRARVSETFGLGEGNVRDIVVPRRDDDSIVLFEDAVDAGLADVYRQVVLLRDASGTELLGLRDVFVPR